MTNFHMTKMKNKGVNRPLVRLEHFLLFQKKSIFRGNTVWVFLSNTSSIPQWSTFQKILLWKSRYHHRSLSQSQFPALHRIILSFEFFINLYDDRTKKLDSNKGSTQSCAENEMQKLRLAPVLTLATWEITADSLKLLYSLSHTNTALIVIYLLYTCVHCETKLGWWNTKKNKFSGFPFTTFIWFRSFDESIFCEVCYPKKKQINFNFQNTSESEIQLQLLCAS